MTNLPDVAPFVEAFRHFRGLDDESEQITLRRDAALHRFASLGFPTRRQEPWRFTDLRPLTATPILPIVGLGHDISLAMLEPFRLNEAAARIVLVNGRFAPELSLIPPPPDGVWFGSFAEAARVRPDLVEAAFEPSDTAGAEPLASLNAAFCLDGFVLAIAPGVTVLPPFEVIHVGRGDSLAASHLRNVVMLGAGSAASLVETALSFSEGWCNCVTAVALGDAASLHHAKLELEAPTAIHTSLVRATLGVESLYDAFALTTGARLSRQDYHVALAGEAGRLALSGLYLLRDDQEATIAPVVDHQALGCRTGEVVKGVMQDRAHGVFLGTMRVRPGADQTDAHQLNRNLLLSRQASVDTKPELEIFADDVKCSHGATVGSLDEAALFYLQARGIDGETARHMLIEAFAAEVIDEAECADSIKAHLRQSLQAWLDDLGSRA